MMRTTLRHALSLVLIVSPVQVIAETPAAGPKGFYPEGFTGGLVDRNATHHFDESVKENTLQRPVENEGLNVTSGFFESTNPAQQVGKAQKATPPDATQDSFIQESKPDRSPLGGNRTLASSLAEKKGIPVLGLGVMVSVNQQDHLVEQMQTMTDAVRKFNIPLTTVYFLGDYVNFFRDGRKKNDISDALTMIPAAGGQLKMAPNIPEKYQVSQSPVWILSTQKGEIVLEGIPELLAYMNSDGEFVEQKSYGSQVEEVNYNDFDDSNLELLMTEEEDDAQ